MKAEPSPKWWVKGWVKNVTGERDWDEEIDRAADRLGEKLRNLDILSCQLVDPDASRDDIDDAVAVVVANFEFVDQALATAKAALIYSDEKQKKAGSLAEEVSRRLAEAGERDERADRQLAEADERYEQMMADAHRLLAETQDIWARCERLRDAFGQVREIAAAHPDLEPCRSILAILGGDGDPASGS